MLFFFFFKSYLSLLFICLCLEENSSLSAIPQRIPSPRELQAHTQSIMQGALIKKKLEEQRENYRRRQEQSVPLAARTTTPAPVASPTKHPAAIAFTPTSVIKFC